MGKPEPATEPSVEHLRSIIALQALLGSADFDLPGFMNTVVDHVQMLTGADSAVIELLEGDEMVYHAASGSGARHIGLRLKAITSLSGLGVSSGKMLYAEDTSTDPRVDAEACRKVGAASMVVTPLYRQGNTVGVLKIMSGKPHAFTPSHIQTLQLVAVVLGGALGQQLEVKSERQTAGIFRHMAHHDSLTGLPNRQLFYDRLSHAIALTARNKQPLALFYMDLDHFKSINDTHGHAMGDAVLKTFAQRVKPVVRTADTLARLGGDEFVLLAENIAGGADAEFIATKIIEAMQPAWIIKDVQLDMGVSIGVALMGAPVDMNTLVKEADKALYEAKKAGRNRFCVIDV